MTLSTQQDVWAKGASYESYVGRWSRLVAQAFLRWIAAPPGGVWLDFGCGTGALTESILRDASPAAVIGVDPADGFVTHARQHVIDTRCRFVLGDASTLAGLDREFDVAVSGLVLNFTPKPEEAMGTIVEAMRPEGLVAAYVWDHAGRMELMRYFWDAAVALDHAAAQLDEGARFPLCQTDRLAALFDGVGLREVRTTTIDVATNFRDFDDYWTPFLSGQGPAPGYCASLDEPRRVDLRERLRVALPVQGDGSIRLIGRALAVKARKR